MTEKLEGKLKEYCKVFGDRFPMIPLGHRGEAEVIKIIDDCIAKKKDVYDSGYLSLDEEHIY